ncbi:MAG TPA: VOC family protein [Anaerolineales bacterium]|nr:VOC family protein [Anaerolineales bacterium]
MNKLPETLTLGAVTLKTAQLDRLTNFYRDIIGLQVRQTSAEGCELGTATHTLIRLVFLANGQPAPHHCGLYHTAIRVPNRTALADWLKQYVDVGYPGWQGASHHGVSEALYLADPEGNGIEVYCDTPRNTWRYPAGVLHMTSRALDLNDLARQQSGQSWQGIHPQSDVGHVHLKVHDIAAAHAFYIEKLGFDLVVSLGSAEFASVGGYHHHLGFNVWESQGRKALPADGIGLASWQIALPDETRLHQLCQRLQLDTPRIQDPSGNWLEFVLQTTP